MSQFKCARSCRAAGKGRSLGTPTLSRRYCAAGMTGAPANAPSSDVRCKAADPDCFASTPTSSACATCRIPACQTAHETKLGTVKCTLKTPQATDAPHPFRMQVRCLRTLLGKEQTAAENLQCRDDRPASASVRNSMAGTAVGSARGALTGRGPGLPGPRSANLTTFSWFLISLAAAARASRSKSSPEPSSHQLPAEPLYQQYPQAHPW